MSDFSDYGRAAPSMILDLGQFGEISGSSVTLIKDQNGRPLGISGAVAILAQDERSGFALLMS